MNKLYSSVVNNESFNLYFPDEGINTSFKEFKIDVFKAAAFLESVGISDGDKLLIYGETSYYYVVFALACAKINAVGILFSEKYGAFEVEHVADNVDKFYVMDVSDESKFKNLDLNLKGKLLKYKTLGDYQKFIKTSNVKLKDEKLDLKNYSYMLLSSGTSGNLKLSFFGPDEMLYLSYHNAKGINLSTRDTLLLSTPIYHFSICFLGAALINSCNVILLKKFSATTCINLINQVEVTVISGVPSVYLALIKKVKDLKMKNLSVKSILSAGDMASDNFKKDIFLYLGVENIYDAYGATEIGSIYVRKYVLCDGNIKVDSTYIIANDIKLDKDNPFYINNIPNYEILVKMKEDSPYVKTGDLGVYSDDGILVTCRKKDIIVKGGQSLSPKFMEGVLKKFISVKNILVIGVGDDFYGEDICVCIESDLNADSLKKNVIDIVNKHLSKPYLPKKIVVFKKFPMLPSGKINTIKIKEMINL